MTKFRVFAAMLATAPLSGCIIPINYATAPGIETRLVDAQTRAPVAGARVTVSAHPTEKKPDRVLVSDADGMVVLEAVSEMIWVLMPQDIFPVQHTMRIDAPGYETYEGLVFERGLGTQGKRSPDVEIALTPKPTS
jgi:hypothetical protein